MKSVFNPYQATLLFDNSATSIERISQESTRNKPASNNESNQEVSLKERDQEAKILGTREWNRREKGNEGQTKNRIGGSHSWMEMDPGQRRGSKFAKAVRWLRGMYGSIIMNASWAKIEHRLLFFSTFSFFSLSSPVLC